jgi:hypothetical protein
VEFPLPSGQGIADIYRPPGQGPYPAILLFLGVAPAASDDPRVVNLGEALARTGAVTMFYWSPVMIEKHIKPDTINNLKVAFQYLQKQPYVNSSRVGMGGFCVGAAFSLMAASQEEIRDEVTFVNAFGSYFDMRDLVRSIASETRFYKDDTEPWSVDSLSKEVFQLQLLEGLKNPEEKRLLRESFIDGNSTILDAKDLSGEANSIYQLLRGASLDQVDQILETLPPELLEQIDLVSPRFYLDGLKTRVLIMHDRQDNLVPSDESRRLFDALQERGNVYYTEFSLFQHVDPSRRVNAFTFMGEIFKLFRHIYTLLRVGT